MQLDARAIGCHLLHHAFGDIRQQFVLRRSEEHPLVRRVAAGGLDNTLAPQFGVKLPGDGHGFGQLDHGGLLSGLLHSAAVTVA